MMFTKPCCWTNERGAKAYSQEPENFKVPYVTIPVPAPVANAAIAAGVAFPADSKEAEHHRHAGYFPRRGPRIPDEEYVDLEVQWPQ